MYICNTLTPYLIANQPQREAKRMVKRRRNLLQLVRPLVETQGTSRVVRVGKVTERKILAFIYFRFFSSTYSTSKRECAQSGPFIFFYFHKMNFFEVKIRDCFCTNYFVNISLLVGYERSYLVIFMLAILLILIGVPFLLFGGNGTHQ